MSTASLTAKFGMDATGLKNELKQVRRSVDKTANRIGKMGLAAATAAFSKLGSDAIRSAAQLKAMAGVTGLSTDKLQELVFAGNQFEVSQEATQQAMQRFNRRLGEARKGYGVLLPELDRYNISLRNSDGNLRSNEAILGDYADAIRGAESEQEQLRLTVAAFDQEGGKLVNVLKDGKQGMAAWGDQAQESGEVMKASTITALAEMKKEIDSWVQQAKVTVGEILVNFKSEEGLQALGFALFEKAARFGGTIVDALAQAGGVGKAVFEGVFTGVSNKFRDLLIERLQQAAGVINAFLPEKYEINVGNLDQFKSSGETIAQSINRAIAETEPTNFADSFSDFWKIAKEQAQQGANALREAAHQAGEQLKAGGKEAGESMGDPIKEGANQLAESGNQAAEPIVQAAREIERSSDGLRGSVLALSRQTRTLFNVTSQASKTILGGQSGESMNQLSDMALKAVLARARKDLARARRSQNEAGLDEARGGAHLMAAAGYQRTIQNAQREIAFRGKFRRVVETQGESAVFGAFPEIPANQLERLLNQFTRNLTEAQRTAEATEGLEIGLRRAGIISSTG